MQGQIPAVVVPPCSYLLQMLFHTTQNLSLMGSFFLPWKDLSIVGKLPKLEVLKLESIACKRETWEVADELVELWATEGFLKVDEMKSIEEVAEKCLQELTNRSLISIQRLRFDGKILTCGMHDVTRELCLREALNVNFVNIFKERSDQNPCVQSMKCFSKSQGRISILNKKELADAITLRLVLLSCLQYLGSEEVVSSSIDIPPSISSLCYLQTFILSSVYLVNFEYPFIIPSEILTMPQLRHLDLHWNYLPYHDLTEKCLELQILGVPDDFRSRKYLCDFRYLDKLEDLTFFLIPQTNACFLDSNNAPSDSTPQPPSFRKKMPDLPLANDVTPLLFPPPYAFPQNRKNLAFGGPFYLHRKDLSIVGKLL
ncbi:hypothetical protein HAX54_006416 [Datura stramonium]|uniref:Disease resistance protein winged helix domain-containing protein n=1 Tax=Datura stramonium TaxID=4076 RepID=A0ABS8TCN3_DATST|nr:hypothetical protein [Datura stramonium]